MTTITNGKKTSNHDASGRFAKGNRASPGRPPGRGAVAELRDMLGQDVDQIITVVRQQALSGDMQAIRIILDRLSPIPRPAEQPTLIDLPEGDLTQQARALVRAAASGDIAPGQASQLITALGTVAKIIEIDDLESRITKLEKGHAKT